MRPLPQTRRDVLKAISVGALGVFGAAPKLADAQPVKWSEGTEPPNLKAPPNACDCHHHIYGSQYKGAQ
jgi:D-galactarolactone isomerase